MIMTEEREKQLEEEIKVLEELLDLQRRIDEENRQRWNTNPGAYSLEFWRERAGEITQVELASRAGVSRETISAAERGVPVSRASLNHIARALGINPALIRINLTNPKQKES